MAKAFIKNIANKEYVDHIDGNPRNNHFLNLRWATPLENCRNKNTLSKHNTSGTIGVNWYKTTQQWRARIKINGVDTELGLFDTKEEAIEVRTKKAQFIYGEFFRPQ